MRMRSEAICQFRKFINDEGYAVAKIATARGLGYNLVQGGKSSEVSFFYNICLIQ